MDRLQQRRQEEKTRRREQIIDAAEAVAAEVGITGMTMDQVARHARLSRALLYVYFADRFDLHIAICVRALTLLQRRFKTSVRRHRRGVDQLLACGRTYVDFARRRPVYFEAISLFQAHAPNTAARRPNEDTCKACGNAVHAITVAALERGVADGSLRRDMGNPLLVAVTLWGFMHGIVQLALTKAEVLREDGLSVKRLIDHGLWLCTRALLPSPQPRRRPRRVGR
jgi:TetR/AcrR family transcriptional regulator